MTLSRPNNLVLAMVGACLLALFVALQWTRVSLVGILTLPFVLYLPGYALSAALLGDARMSGAERFLWSAGLSIAVAILGGMLLALTPWGLQTTTWVILLLAVTGIAGAFALVRRYEPFTEPLSLPRLKISLGNVALFGFALVAILVALQLARLPAPAASVNGYTSLWVLPSGETNTRVIQFGFTSQETQPTMYRVVLQVNGQPVHMWQDITLKPGEQWKNSFDASNVVPNAQIEAVLYRIDEPNVVYRSVVLNPK